MWLFSWHFIIWHFIFIDTKRQQRQTESRGRNGVEMRLQDTTCRNASTIHVFKTLNSVCVCQVLVLHWPSESRTVDLPKGTRMFDHWHGAARSPPRSWLPPWASPYWQKQIRQNPLPEHSARSAHQRKPLFKSVGFTTFAKYKLLLSLMRMT